MKPQLAGARAINAQQNNRSFRSNWRQQVLKAGKLIKQK
jgi:hypothetical protein